MTRKVATTKDQVLDLYSMLTTCRPHLSPEENAFIGEFITPLGVKEDTFGNLYKRIGTAPVMWSSHTDTVHHKGGAQDLALRDKRWIVLHKDSKSNCLGADDTAGVWLMTQMIKAEVPGLYVFHRGEEVGCKGSEWIARNNKEALAGIQACIALDRRGFDHVITFQRGQRCCSDDFGKSLAEELNSVMWGNSHMDYTTDDTGVYTDSASYTDIIGECTNLSVGYSGQHGRGEKLDRDHLICLREALLQIDLSKLRYSRVAGTRESKYKSWGGYQGYHQGYESWEDVFSIEYEGCGAREFYVKEYHKGYWDLKASKWVEQSYKEWETWRTKIMTKSNTKFGPGARVWDSAKNCFVSLADKNKPAVTSTIKPATTNFKETLSRQDNKPLLPKPQKKVGCEFTSDEMTQMLVLIANNPEAIARCLLTWGWDIPMARELVFEYSTPKTEEKTVAPPQEGAPTLQ